MRKIYPKPSLVTPPFFGNRIFVCRLQIFIVFHSRFTYLDTQDKPLECRVEKMLIVGLPVTRTLEAANKVGARMVVMGSKGRSGLSHILLGSKAEQIVRLSPVPVTIVKAQETQNQ